MSQSIDERVVEMRFDNKQFENGAKETLTTIEKLKSALNFDSSAKAFESIEKAANNVSLESIASGIESLQDRFSTLGIVGMRVIENITDSLMNMASSAMSYVSDAIVSGGLKRAQNIENAHFQLQALLKDEEAVQAVMDNAMASVDGTAYAYDEAAKAASQFAASGMRAGEEMISALRGITGVAAMTNSEYEGISRIFTTVAGNGRLMGDQLLQLSSRGLNAAATISDYFQQVKGLTEITEADIREMVSKGEISFKEFAAAMDWAFGESAFRANETFTGALSNMRSALSRIGAGFFSPLIEQNSDLIGLINTLREKFNDVKKALVFDEQTSAISGLAKATQLTTSELKALFSEIDQNGSVSLSNIQKLSDNGIDAIQTITKYINGVVDGSIRATYSTKTALDELTGGIAVSQDQVEKFISEGKINLAEFTSAMEEAYGDQKNLSKQFTDSVLNMSQRVSEFLKNLDLSTPLSIFYYGVETIKNLFKGLFSVLKPVGKAFANVFLSFSSEDAINVAEKIENITSKLRLSETASNNLQVAFEGLFNVVKLVIDIFAGLLGVTAPVLNPIGSLTELITSLAAAFGRGLTKMTEWVRGSELLQKVYQKLSSIIKEAAKSITNFITHIGEYIKKVYELEFTQTVIEMSIKAFRKLYTKGREYFGLLIDKLQEFKDWIIDMIPDSVKIKFDNFIEKLKELKNALFTMDASQATEHVHKFTEKVRGLFDILKGNQGLNTFISNMKDYFQRLSDAFTFENLYENIDKFKNKVGSFITWIRETLGPVFEDVTFGGVVSTAGGFGIIYSIIKVAKSFQNITNTLNSIPLTLGSIRSTLKAYQQDLKADMLLKIAEAITLLAVALTFLSFADMEQVYKGAIVLTAIGAALLLGVGYFEKGLAGVKGITATIYTVANTVAKSLNNLAKAVKWKAIGDAVKSMATSLGIIVAAILVLAYAYSKDSENVMKGMELVGIIATALVGLITSMSLLGNKLDTGMKAFSKASNGVLALSASLLVVVLALKSLFKLELPADWENRLTILGLLFGALAALTVVVAAASKIASSKGFQSVSGSNITTSASQSGSVAGSILGVVASLYLCVMALDKLFKIDLPSDYKQKFALLAGMFLGLVVAVVAVGVASAVSKDGLKGAATILAMCAFIATTVASLAVLSIFPADKLLTGAITLGITLIALGLALAGAANIAGKNNWKTVLAMALEIGAITAALGVLSMLSGDDLLKASASLGAILLALAVDFLAVSKVTDTFSFASILAMAANIVIIASSLYVLADQPWPNLVSAASSLGIVLLSVAEAFKIISKSNPNVTDIASFLTGVMGVIMASFAISMLAEYDWSSMLAAAGSIAIVLDSMAVAFGILSITRVDLLDMLSYIGGILGIGAIALILAKLADQPWDGMLAAAGSIAIVLDSMAVALAISSIVGALAPEAIIGILLLDAFIANFLLVLGSLSLLTYGAEEFLAKGAEVLKALGTYLGEFIGSILGGVVSGITSSLPEVGTHLSGFATNAETFFSVIGSLNPSVLDGAKTLAETLLILTGAQLLNGIASFLSGILGGSMSFEEFGGQLKSFGKGIKAFSDEVEGISSSDTEAAANCAKVLQELYNNMPKEDGWVQKIFGQQKSLSEFAEELVPFGRAMVTYSKTVTGKIDESAVEASTNAAKMIIALYENLPDMGGFVDKIFGTTMTLAEFAEELKPFGEAMVEYSSTVNGQISESSVEASTNAAKMIIALYENLPDMGGFLDQIFGTTMTLAEFAEELVPFGRAMTSYSSIITEGFNTDEAVEASINSAKALAGLYDALPELSSVVSKFFSGSQMTLVEFAEELVPFGRAMVTYSKTVTDKINEGAIQASVTAARILNNFQQELPELSSVISKFFSGGQMTLAEFAEELVPFGEAMASYSKTVSGSIDQSAIKISVNAAKSLNALQSELTGEKGLLSLFSRDMNLDDFGKDLEKFGSGLAAYSKSISTIDTSQLTSVIDEVASLVDLANGMNNLNTSGMTKFPDALKKLSDSGIKGFIESFKNGTTDAENAVMVFFDAIIASATTSGKSLKESATAIGKDTSAGLKIGITSKTPELLVAIQSLCKSLIDKLQNSLPESTFKTRGNYIVTWLKDGMNSKQSNLLNMIKEICKAVISKFKEQLPTRIFTTLGETVTIALSNGILNKKENVLSAVRQLCKELINTFKDKNDGFTEEKLKAIGEAAAKGLATGIKNKISEIKDAAVKAAKEAIDSAKTALEIASPSKIFIAIGEFVSLGLAKGILAKLNIVSKASDELAKESMDVVNDFVKVLGDIIDDDQDLNPVITPVMDLSQVEKSMNDVSEMFEQFNKLNTYEHVLAASNSFSQRGRNIENTSDNIGDETKGPTYTMNQYNYSPKALSQSEIYRQTKTLFSRFKEVASNA